MPLYVMTGLEMLKDTLDPARPVLIVDDSPMYRTAAKGMLQRLGYPIHKVDFAQDAKEAMLKCQANSYSLILFDYNLGKKANGYQLIDQLKFENLIAPDCVSIIVTGDATPEVVRGFMELEPDGYLLKPLNYATLKERLPLFSAKKRQLADILNLMGNQRYQDAVECVDQSFYRDDEIIVKSQLIKARALFQLEQFDEARNILISLKGSSEHPNVLLELALIAYKQRQFKQGVFLTEQVKKDPLRSALAYDLSSEIYAAQKQFESALNEIETAISTSPKKLARHEKRIAFAMAQLQFSDAINAIKALLHESKNSFRDTVDYFLLAASLHLDIAQFGGVEANDTNITAVAKWVEQWRQNFTRDQYKAFELLIFCRVFRQKGDFIKSRTYFNQYLQHIEQTPKHEPSIFEQFEFFKASFSLRDTEKHQQAIESINKTLADLSLNATQQGLAHYFNQYRTKSEHSHAKLLKIKSYAKQYVTSKQYEKAANLLGKSMKENLMDTELCLLTLDVFTKSWPQNWSRLHVAKIAIICKEHLRDTKQSKSALYVNACDMLSKQLNLSDLKVSKGLAV